MGLLAFEALALPAYFALSLPTFFEVAFQEDILAVVARFVLAAVDFYVSFDLDVTYFFELFLSEKIAGVIHVDRLSALVFWTVQDFLVKAITKGANVLCDAQPTECAATVDESIRIAHCIGTDITFSFFDVRQFQYLVLYTLKS